MGSNRNLSRDVQPMLEILEPRLMLDGVGEPDPLDLPGAAPPTAPASTMVDYRQFNPSSRMSGLIISEIMYNPLDPDGVGGIDPDDLEFIEIYNSEEVSNDLSGYELTGEVDFVFPEGTVLGGRSYLVVAPNPTVAEPFYGITGILGPYTGHLTNGGGTQRLRNQMNAILQDIQYSDDYPWSAAADGAGHSLVMMRPDYGEDNVEAWEASDYVNGNPGTYSRTFTDNLADVVINEVLVHTDLPDIDFVELYNHSNSSVNIGGLTISDKRPDEPGYTEYMIPWGTTIAARGHISFDQTTLGFSLNMQGDEVYLRNIDGDRVIDAIKFGAQENGVSLGRYVDGSDEFRVLSATTPGAPNAEPVNYDIVINEIMYHPVTDHQNEVVGVGDGTTADFAGTLGRDLLRRGSIQFTDGSQVVTDDGNGNLVGDLNPGGDNVIDYDTGAFSLTLAAAPVLYVRVTVDYDVNAAFEDTDYEFVELYNRGGSDVDLGSWKFTEGIRYTFPAFQQHEQDIVDLGDGATTEFAGSLPQDDLRAGSIQFTDGTQIVTDDGAGNLIGDVNPGGTNSIDYATGAFSVTFATAPAAGSPVTANYENSTILRPGEYLVVAKDDRELIAANPGVLNAGNTVGDYSGQLSDRGERIVLTRPDDPLLPLQDFVVIDEVLYTDGESWGTWADGGGSSLELIDPHSDNMRASNWADSDETDKAPWTLVTYTGELDHGRNAADEVQILLEGKGEALLDDVEVFKSGEGNRVANSTFESGIGGWVIQGTHIESHLETTEGYASSQSLHLVSSRTGDNAVNRVEHDLSSALSDGNIATIQARVRWLAGTPGILLRLHGGWIEAPGIMDLPTNLGSPGAVNSRYAANAGPAIYDVTHLPVLPSAGQNVVVTARVADVDGLSTVELKYRNDTDTPWATYTVAMNDSGVSGDAIAGDGIYSATIPGQGSNDLVAFYVQAIDSHASSATTRFPTAAPDEEAHIMFGQYSRSGTFGTLRFWMTEADRVQWQNRQKHSDHPIHGTFVYGDFRVIYNAGGRFRGSPWIRSNGNPETLGTSYVFYVPKDSRVMGARSFNLDRLEGDDTRQRERMSLWLADQTDTPFFNQRYMHLYVNEYAKNPIYADSHSPNDDYVAAYWSAGTDGDLFKIDDWFEFNDNSQVNKEFNIDARVQLYLTGGQKNQGRYRWSWRKEPQGGFDDDYTSFFDMVDALNYDYMSDQFAATAPMIIDYDEWMHTFAIQHVINNWDSYGFNRGKNMSLYLPDDGQWQMIMWDLDHSHMSGGTHDNNLFSINDGVLRNEFFNYPLFRRAYWRSIQEIADAMEASRIDPVMDANYSAFQANGVSVGDPNSALKAWVAGRRSYLLGQIAIIDASFAITTNGGVDYSTGQQIVTIAGTAPVAVKTMYLNGNEVEVDFSSVTNWSLQLGLVEGDNVLVFEGFDFKGNLVASDTITVTLTNPGVSPVGQVVINEIMYNPADVVEQGEYIEIYNASPTTAFDMSGWRIDGADFTFAPGSIITAGEYVVVVENSANFVATYGLSPTVLGQYNGSLSNGGERLRLQMPAGGLLWTTVDEVTYSDDLPWPVTADGTGPSLQLIDPTKDNGWIGNWAADASTHYTPGEVNSIHEILPAFPQVRINEIMGNNVSPLQDNAGQYDPWIELFEAGSTNVMAVEVHQANPNGGDATMELSLNFSEPIINELSFQNGVNGYTGTVDTEIRFSNPAGDLSGAVSINVDGVDGGGAVHALIRFDDIFGGGAGQVAWDVTILDATLTFDIFDAGDTMRMHRMAAAWAETANWNSFGGDGVNADGVDAETAYLDVSGGVGTRTIDVTQAVQEWQAGTEVNNGWAFLPTSSNGIDFYSSESGSVASRPELIITIDDVGLDTEIIPLDATWKYLDDGSDQGAAWRDPIFDDSAWSSGAAVLGYGNGDETTALAAGPTTYYFRHVIDLQETAVVSPELSIRADDGAIVYLNGTEVFRINMPEGPVDFATEALTPIEGAAEADFTETMLAPGLFQTNVSLGVLTNMRLTDDYTQPFKWSFPAGTPLATGEYMTVWVDGETGQQTPTDMHTSFAMDGLPGSLAVVWDYNGTPIVVDYVDYDYTPDDQSQGRWPNGQGEMFAMDSPTPAAFNSGPALGSVIINEVHYNPTDLNDYEFIEIYNRSGAIVNLWETHDTIDYPWEIEGFEFAIGASLLPDETMVIVPFDPVAEPATLAAFKTRYSLELSPVQIVGGYGNNLDNGGEMVRIERPLPLVGSPAFTPYETVDAVRYDDEAPWPTEPDGGGDSLHRMSADAWGNDSDNWTTALPNPGSFVIANSAPHVVTPIADLSVDEDDGDTVLDLSATFDDIDIGEFLTLSVTGNSNVGLVTASIVGTDLTLSYVADRNGTSDVTIRATDQGGLWVEDTFTVTVAPVGDPPTVANPIGDVTVDEDSGSDLLDLSATFHDPDLLDALPDTLTLTVTGNTNPGLVTTSVDGMELTLSYVPLHDGTTDITVRATDGDSNWIEDTFTVTVNPINHPPHVIGSLDVVVDEDAPDMPIDLAPEFGDVDPGDTLTFSIIDNTEPSLVATSLIGDILTLSFTPNANGTAIIRVRATDSGSPVLWIDETFTVTVNPVNDAPTVADPIDDILVNENDPDTVLSLLGAFADVDIGDSLTLSVSGNTNPGLVTAGVVGSQLTLSYLPDQNGTAEITVRATDSGTPGMWVEDTFTVAVNSDNFSPTVTNPIADVTVDEDAPDTVLDMSDVFADNYGVVPTFDYTAVEIDPVTGAPSVGTGLFVYSFTLYGHDGVDASFATTSLTFSGAIQQTKAFFSIDVNDESTASMFEGIAGSGYIAALDTWMYDGWDNIAPGDTDVTGTTVIMSVGSGTTTFYQSKDVVRIVAAGDVTWNGEFARQGVAYETSGTASGDRLTLSVQGNTNPGLATASMLGLQLTLSYAPEASGTADITIRAMDNEGAWTDETFTVTVDPVNDAPVADANGPYEMDMGDDVALDGTGSSDVDIPDGDSITYAWDLDNDGQFDDATGATPLVTWTDIVDMGLSYPTDPVTGLPSNTISLRVTDSLSLTDTASTTLKIFSNDPVAAFSANPNPAAPTQSISFDGSASSHGHALRSIVQYEWDFDYDGGTFDVDATGVAPLHSYGLFGTYTAALRVTDDNAPAKTDIATTVIDVDQGNRPPVADANGPYEVDLDAGLVLDGTGSSDPDAGYGDSIVSYDLDIASGTYLLSGASPSLTPAQIDALGAGEFQVILTVTDTFSVIDSDQTTLTVNSLAEVVGRHVFYNNSALDAGGDDDAAIASDKTALLPGGVASSANYTSYSRGINGIMVDIDGLAGVPLSGDFGVRVNEAANPDTWSAGPAPESVTVRAGEGVGGSDRVTLVWADGAITSKWVEVSVLATANTGLTDADVLYFGNVVGDTNGDAAVDGGDLNTLVAEFGLRGGAELDTDFNVDGRVNLADFAIMRGNLGNSVGMPTVPAAPPAAAAPPAPAAAPVFAPNVDLLAGSATSNEEDVIVGGDILFGAPVSVEVTPIDLPAATEEPASVFEPVASDDVLPGEDILSPGDGLEAVLDMDDLLVDVLAESSVV